MPRHTELTAYILDALWLAIILYWILRAFSNKKTIYRQSRARRLLNVLIVAALGVVISNTPHIHKHFFISTPATEIIGIALTLAGIAFAIHARNTLGKNWSGNPTLKQDHQLITAGPYRFVRHPIYTSLVLALAGTMFALLPSIAGIAYVILLAASFALKLRFEEKLMMQQFPEAYPAYRVRVRTAFLPGIY